MPRTRKNTSLVLRLGASYGGKSEYKKSVPVSILPSQLTSMPRGWSGAVVWSATSANGSLCRISQSSGMLSKSLSGPWSADKVVGSPVSAAKQAAVVVESEQVGDVIGQAARPPQRAGAHWARSK